MSGGLAGGFYPGPCPRPVVVRPQVLARSNPSAAAAGQFVGSSEALLDLARILIDLANLNSVSVVVLSEFPIFVKDRKSVILGVWAAPGARETIPLGGGLRTPPFARVFGAPGAAQTPK